MAVASAISARAFGAFCEVGDLRVFNEPLEVRRTDFSDR